MPRRNYDDQGAQRRATTPGDDWAWLLAELHARRARASTGHRKPPPGGDRPERPTTGRQRPINPTEVEMHP